MEVDIQRNVSSPIRPGSTILKELMVDTNRRPYYNRCKSMAMMRLNVGITP